MSGTREDDPTEKYSGALPELSYHVSHQSNDINKSPQQSTPKNIPLPSLDIDISDIDLSDSNP